MQHNNKIKLENASKKTFFYDACKMYHGNMNCKNIQKKLILFLKKKLNQSGKKNYKELSEAV